MPVVVIVGDSGTGKSSLVQLLCHGRPTTASPTATVGCAVDVLVLPLTANFDGVATGTSTAAVTAAMATTTTTVGTDTTPRLVELWEVGGATVYEKSRSVFFAVGDTSNTDHELHGVVLVHDLTNRKSYRNLWRWLGEVHHGLHATATDCGRNKDGGREGASSGASGNGSGSDGLDQDDEQTIGDDRLRVPVLIIGTKADLLPSDRRAALPSARNSLAQDLRCEAVAVDTTRLSGIVPALPQLERFFEAIWARSRTTRSPRPSIAAPLISATSEPGIMRSLMLSRSTRALGNPWSP